MNHGNGLTGFRRTPPSPISQAADRIKPSNELAAAVSRLFKLHPASALCQLKIRNVDRARFEQVSAVVSNSGIPFKSSVSGR
jgi:hypothetical protein